MNLTENVQLVLSCGFAVSAIILSTSLPIWIVVRHGSKEWLITIKKFKEWATGQMGMDK